MGAEVCKNVQKDEINEIQAKPVPKNCLNLCYNSPTENDIKTRQEIKPIDFSDLDQDPNDPKSHIEPCRSETLNNGTTGRHFDENKQNFEQNSTNSQFKSKIAKNFTSASNEKGQEPESMRNSEMVLVVRRDGQGNLEYGDGVDSFEPISVPFSVIKLVIKPEILRQVKKLDRDFIIEHGRPEAETFLSWKLLQNGCYINKISDGSTIVITDSKYYRGGIERDSFTPTNIGMLVTLQGSYKGNFKQGKAHGEGSYVSASGNKKISGQWENGSLLKGKIETEEYRYEGQLLGSIPHGKGALKILKTNVEYTGKFVQGLFEDQQGLYTCHKYSYRGGFVRGKKDGEGILIFPVRAGKNKNSNRLKGIFKQDKLISVNP